MTLPSMKTTPQGGMPSAPAPVRKKCTLCTLPLPNDGVTSCKNCFPDHGKDIVHVYSLVSPSRGHKYHLLCYPVNGERPIAIYDDKLEVANKRMKKLIDAGNK